jgi:CDP-diacylglycerol--glycerol-3-phosphate 3-phosphatidyltransferase
MRLVSAPAVLYLLNVRLFAECFVVFLCASVTDFLDGYAARRFGASSSFGSALDPLADKALMFFFYYGAYRIGAAPLWLFSLIVSRDVLILAAALHIICKQYRRASADSVNSFKPSFISKLNTVFQLILALVILFDLCVGTDWTGAASEALICIVGITTLVSGIQYLVFYLRFNVVR